MIDLHCHILPGLDDGAGDLEESLAMAQLAFGDGVHTIVATPHSLNGLYRNTLKEIARGVDRLRSALAERGLDVRILPGADVHLCPNMVERIGKGDAVTLDNAGRYLLLELPPQSLPEGLREEIFSLRIHGVTPIITHPERHPLIQRDPGILREMISLGALAQVTAMSVTGEFGGLVMACAEAMVENRLVHVVASDAHSSESRPPLLSSALEAVEEILGSHDEAEWMVRGLPAAILAGESVDVPAPAKLKKTLSFFLNAQ